MIESLLHHLADNRPGRIITDGKRPYLERYFLFRAFGVTVYLHRFVGNDPDRGLHDHPWRWAATLVLAGPGYIEHTRYGLRRRKRFGAFGGQHMHRVVLIEKQPTWTLFVHSSARVKPWGFWRHRSVLTSPAGTQAAVSYVEHASAAAEWWRTAPEGRFLEGRTR